MADPEPTEAVTPPSIPDVSPAPEASAPPVSSTAFADLLRQIRDSLVSLEARITALESAPHGALDLSPIEARLGELEKLSSRLDAVGEELRNFQTGHNAGHASYFSKVEEGAKKAGEAISTEMLRIAADVDSRIHVIEARVTAVEQHPKLQPNPRGALPPA